MNCEVLIKERTMLCGRAKKDWQAMCLRHWRQVPKALRDQLWSLYRSAPGSPEHLAALGSAIESVAS